MCCCGLALQDARLCVWDVQMAPCQAQTCCCGLALQDARLCVYNAQNGTLSGPDVLLWACLAGCSAVRVGRTDGAQ